MKHSTKVDWQQNNNLAIFHVFHNETKIKVYTALDKSTRYFMIVLNFWVVVVLSKTCILKFRSLLQNFFIECRIVRNPQKKTNLITKTLLTTTIVSPTYNLEVLRKFANELFCWLFALLASVIYVIEQIDFIATFVITNNACGQCQGFINNLSDKTAHFLI